MAVTGETPRMTEAERAAMEAQDKELLEKEERKLATQGEQSTSLTAVKTNNTQKSAGVQKLSRSDIFGGAAPEDECKKDPSGMLMMYKQ